VNRPAQDENLRVTLRPHDASNLPVIARLEALARDARKHGFDVLGVKRGGEPLRLILPRPKAPVDAFDPTTAFRD
jgi:hypothetical protein